VAGRDNDDPRFTAGLIHDVQAVLEQHGYRVPAGEQDRRRALGACLVPLLRLTRAFEGRSLESAPWYPPRAGDQVYIRYSDAGARPEVGETYVVDAGPEGLVLRLLSHTLPEDAVVGYYAPGLPGEPLREIWATAGPARLTIVRDYRMVHEGGAE
jgi:hypothetical protein